MILKFIFKIKFTTNILLLIVTAKKCSDLTTHSNLKFYLWKSFHRSLKEILFLDNVENLEGCKQLARQYRGLAFNYSPKERGLEQSKDLIGPRDHYWQQPHLYFNCHVLQCPENGVFKTMVNDISFDYFSLYEKPMTSSDYICLPEIGLFVLHTIPETYQNASLKCRHSQDYCGTLAHVASQKRTEALSRLIASYNEQQSQQVKIKVHLAYVGLQYNSTWSDSLEFYNVQKENVRCFSYRAWEPGISMFSSELVNASCVALTLNRSWKTVKCNRKLPFICEILTSCRG